MAPIGLDKELKMLDTHIQTSAGLMDVCRLCRSLRHKLNKLPTVYIICGPSHIDTVLLIHNYNVYRFVLPAEGRKCSATAAGAADEETGVGVVRLAK